MRQGGDEANRVPTRGDIHVMLVGDPGLGKSQLLQVQCGRGGVGSCRAAVVVVGIVIPLLSCLIPCPSPPSPLQAAAAAAPRGLYVCGKTSTSAGLTVSVVR